MSYPRKVVAALLALILLGGCASASKFLTKANPLNWGSGRAAKAEAKAEVKKDGLEESFVQRAQVEVVKTGAAIAVARVENPESRPVEIAERTNANAAALLNQRAPLDVATAQAALDTVKGLLSAESKAREKAERAQIVSEEGNRELSSALDSTRKELDKLKAKADAEAMNNLELARELNNERMMKYGAAGLSVALGLLSVAYRLNIGRLQSGAAEVLSRLESNHGPAAAATARGALDATLHTGEQQGVFKVFAKLNPR